MRGFQPDVNVWLNGIASPSLQQLQACSERDEPQEEPPDSGSWSPISTEPARRRPVGDRVAPATASSDARSLANLSARAVHNASSHDSDDNASRRPDRRGNTAASQAQPTAFTSSSRRYSIPARRRRQVRESYFPERDNPLSSTVSPQFSSLDQEALSSVPYRPSPSTFSPRERDISSPRRYRYPPASDSRLRSDSYSPVRQGPPLPSTSRSGRNAYSSRRRVYFSESVSPPRAVLDSSPRRRASSRSRTRPIRLPSSSAQRVVSPDSASRARRAFDSALQLEPSTETHEPRSDLNDLQSGDDSEQDRGSTANTLRRAAWTALPDSSQSTLLPDSLIVNVSGSQWRVKSDLLSSAARTALPASADSLLSQGTEDSKLSFPSPEPREDLMDLAARTPLPESIASRSDLLELASRTALPESPGGELHLESEIEEPIITPALEETVQPSNAKGAVLSKKHRSVPRKKEAKKRKSKHSKSNATTFDSYWSKVVSLSRCLPHLNNLQSTSGRYELTGTLTCIDITAAGPTHCVVYRMVDAPSRLALVEAVQDQLKITQPDVMHRVIMVEDLCSDLIDALGTTFRLDPEFFAEHLNRAAYDTFDHDNPLPSSWPSRDMPKSYASVTWFRPYRQNPKVVEWLKESPAILARPAFRLRSLKAARRILDPVVQPYNHGPSSLRREARNLNGIAWKEPQRIENRRPIRVMHKAVVSANIFRKSWPLSTSSTGHVDEDFHSGEYSDEINEMKHKLVPTLWTETASISRYSQGNVQIYILLVDPLPGFSDLRQSVTPGGFRTELDAKDITMGLPFVPRVMPQLPVNKYEASLAQRQELALALGTMVSTKDTILAQARPPWRLHPVLGLLQTVYEDTRAARLTLEHTLDDISRDSLDDYLMTRQASSWRQLINDMSIELPTNALSLYWFAMTIDNQQTNRHVWTIYEQTRVDVEYMVGKLKDAYAALRIDMQFTESRRSITEAKSVAKLTELAFLFIPLSFTASLFSMSIQGLETPAPVWTFITMALGFAVVAYSARFVLASDVLADVTRSALEQFWTRRNVRKGDSAPFHTLVYLTAQELWSEYANRVKTVLYLLPTLPILLVSIAFMCTTTSMGTSFKIAVAIAIIFFEMIAMLETIPEDAIESHAYLVPWMVGFFRRQRHRKAGSGTTTSLR